MIRAARTPDRAAGRPGPCDPRPGRSGADGGADGAQGGRPVVVRAGPHERSERVAVVELAGHGLPGLVQLDDGVAAPQVPAAGPRAVLFEAEGPRVPRPAPGAVPAR